MRALCVWVAVEGEELEAVRKGMCKRQEHPRWGPVLFQQVLQVLPRHTELQEALSHGFEAWILCQVL